MGQWESERVQVRLEIGQVEVVRGYQEHILSKKGTSSPHRVIS